MPSPAATWASLSQLLSYPGPDYAECLERCRRLLQQEHSEAALLVTRFAERIQALSREAIQELYTRTFDLNPLCSLEVGWQLYGEDYARGRFLVALRGRLRHYGIPESAELPDHLTHILLLLDEMETAEAREFGAAFVLPALEKMLAGLQEKNNPYQNVLRAISELLRARQGNRLAEVSHA